MRVIIENIYFCRKCYGLTFTTKQRKKCARTCGGRLEYTGHMEYQFPEKRGAVLKVVVGYRAAHLRIERDRGKASTHLCMDCGAPAEEWSLRKGEETHDINTKPYSLDVYAYDARCISCHHRYDGIEPVRPFRSEAQ